MKFTERQLNILCHATGRGNPVWDKIPESQRRNWYCASTDPDPEIEDLVREGLLYKGNVINEGKAVYYHVSGAGFDFLNRIAK